MLTQLDKFKFFITKYLEIIYLNFEINQFLYSLIKFSFFFLFNLSFIFLIFILLKKYSRGDLFENIFKSLLVWLFIINFISESIGKIYFNINLFFILYSSFAIYITFNYKSLINIKFFNGLELHNLIKNLVCSLPILCFLFYILFNDLFFGPVLKHDANAYHLPSAINYKVNESTAYVEYFKFHTNFFPHFSSILYSYYLIFKGDLNGVIFINHLIILICYLGVFLFSRNFFKEKSQALLASTLIFTIPIIVTQSVYITNDIFIIAFFISSCHFFLKKDLAFFMISCSLLIASKFIGLLLAFFLCFLYFIDNFKLQFQNIKNYIVSLVIIISGFSVYIANYVNFQNPFYPFKIIFFDNFYKYNFPGSVLSRINKNTEKTLLSGNFEYSIIEKFFTKLISLLSVSYIAYILFILIIFFIIQKLNKDKALFKIKDLFYYIKKSKNYIYLFIASLMPILIIGEPMDGDNNRYYNYLLVFFIYLSIFILSKIKSKFVVSALIYFFLFISVLKYFPKEIMLDSYAKEVSPNRKKLINVINHIPKDEHFIFFTNGGQLTYELMSVNHRRKAIIVTPHGFHHDYFVQNKYFDSLYNSILKGEIKINGYKSENYNYAFKKYGSKIFEDIRRKENISYIFASTAQDFAIPKNWKLLSGYKYGNVYQIIDIEK